MFEADERQRARFAHRSDQDKEFFINHGHWPEVLCEKSDCRELWSEELRRKMNPCQRDLKRGGDKTLKNTWDSRNSD